MRLCAQTTVIIVVNLLGLFQRCLYGSILVRCLEKLQGAQEVTHVT